METSRFIDETSKCYERVSDQSIDVATRVEIAIELAGYILKEADRIQTTQEKCIQEQLARMMSDPQGKAFTTNMTDQCFRSKNVSRVADQLIYLIHEFGIPRYLSNWKKFQLEFFRIFGKSLSFLLVPLARNMLRRETRTVILPGEPQSLIEHLKTRFREHVRVNLNRLGEKILGEEDAESRMDQYLRDLQDPNIEYISIKISTIYSQINPLSWNETLSVLCDRLRTLYRAAKNNKYQRDIGEQVFKFINLDMESYSDLHLTIESFRHVLSEEEFFNYSAGIVLQSYLPDSYDIQQQLTVWAMDRVARGGSPIKIRIVKGANLAMEKIEASLKGWPQAPYECKRDVDSNFKRMLHYGFQPECAHAVHLGIASHNIFDIAYSLLLRREKRLEKYICFEMLEGMADHIRRVVQLLSGDMLLYCPAATKKEFQSAVAYLVRRLDENTAPENFLHDAFRLLPGTEKWRKQTYYFLNAFENIHQISSEPRRQQNRYKEPLRIFYDSLFINEPNTDWMLPINRQWADEIIVKWSNQEASMIPLVIGERLIFDPNKLGIGEDPSKPGKCLYKYALAGKDEVEIALDTGVKGFNHWSSIPLRSRLQLIDEVAHLLRVHRGDLIGVMIADTGKVVSEADAEVSEAIDFAEYYRRSAEKLYQMKDIEWEAKGVVLVAPPWNFPCAIPAGGILAALATGNSVIFKPAPEAVYVGWKLVNIFWEAGIGKDVLQFICCEDDPVGSLLIQDQRVNTVILTGATSTARKMLRMRPGIDLIAETGGKNAMIITRLADRDLAIKDLIYSAFGHSGQKCSACSLAILEKEVYDDPNFRSQLKDAAASLFVGSAWQLTTVISPLIKDPNPELLRALTQLEEGEEWLLEPKQDTKNTKLWSPGIKLGVKLGSFMHQTELFGPVLGVMCAKSLDSAISMANSTPYGLTAGIHTLDRREQLYWIEHIIAGNCYVNRGITGAIVQRQPFGGCKESSFGGGLKAGGPNYLQQLMRVKGREKIDSNASTGREIADGAVRYDVVDIANIEDQEAVCIAVSHFDRQVDKTGWSERSIALWKSSLASYAFHYKYNYSKTHDESHILGQNNLLYYVPQFSQVLRIQENDLIFDLLRLMAAFLSCHAILEISISKERKKEISSSPWIKKSKSITFLEESEEELLSRIHNGIVRRVRLLSAPSPQLQRELADSGCHVVQSQVHGNGQIELLHCLREVSLSVDYHRYGYV